MDNLFSKLGGTKFFLTVLVEILAFVLVYLGKLDGTQYAALAGGVASFFMGANAASTFGNAKIETAKRSNPECP